MRGKIATTLLLLVGACASPTIWDKAGATQADFNKDSYECQKDAYATGGAVYVGYGVTQRTVNRPMYDNCMVAHGYTARPKG
jgi:hypothetical protein